MNPLAIEFRNKWGLQETWMPEDARARRLSPRRVTPLVPVTEESRRENRVDHRVHPLSPWRKDSQSAGQNNN